MFRSASLFIGTSSTVAVFTTLATSNVDSIVGIPHKIYSMQRILNHIKNRSLCWVSICTQGMQRTWWSEAGTIIVIGPYCETLVTDNLPTAMLERCNSVIYRPSASLLQMKDRFDNIRYNCYDAKFHNANSMIISKSPERGNWPFVDAETHVQNSVLLILLVLLGTYELTHWGRDKMAAISQTTFPNTCHRMKIYEFRLTFHWSLFLRLNLTTVKRLI